MTIHQNYVFWFRQGHSCSFFAHCLLIFLIILRAVALALWSIFSDTFTNSQKSISGLFIIVKTLFWLQRLFYCMCDFNFVYLIINILIRLTLLGLTLFWLAFLRLIILNLNIRNFTLLSLVVSGLIILRRALRILILAWRTWFWWIKLCYFLLTTTT